MALIKGEKVYRNLQEQVYENTCDIKELLRMYGYHGPYTSTDVIPNDDLYNRAMYLIGTGMPYKVYQYSDITKRFTYIGDYNMDVGPEGPQGPQGPQGERGPDGKPASEIVNIETYDVVYKEDTTESKVRANFDDGHSNEFSVYAKNGSQGQEGPMGPQGPQGPKGEPGPAGKDGKDGLTTSITVNGNTYEQIDGNITLPDYSSSVEWNDINNKPNVVTLDTDQTITGNKKFTKFVNVYDDWLFDPSRYQMSRVAPGGLIFGEWNEHGITDGVQLSGYFVNNPDQPDIQIWKDHKRYYDLKWPSGSGTLARIEDIEMPPLPSNMATVDTEQDITAKKTFTAGLEATVVNATNINATNKIEAKTVFSTTTRGTDTLESYQTGGSLRTIRYYSNDTLEQGNLMPNTLSFINKSISGNPNHFDINFVNNKPKLYFNNFEKNTWIDYTLPHWNESNIGNNLEHKEYILATTEDISGLATKEEVTAVANDLSNHTSNDTIHVTASDKAEWSNKVNQEQIADMATKTDLNDYATKVELGDYELKSDAFSGDYNDLTNKPSIPTKTSELTNDSGFIDSSALTGLATETYANNAANNAANDAVNSLDQTLAQVAKTGSYSDLSDKPDLSIYELKSEAFKGNYEDLTNKPDLSVYELKSEAFSGDYNDLTNKPTIPVVEYPVTSVNSKTGDVVLAAADIKADNKTTVQSNITRIDAAITDVNNALDTEVTTRSNEIARVEGLIPDISGKLDKVTTQTSTAQVYYKTSGGTNKMLDCTTTDANYQSIMMRDTKGHCSIVDPVVNSDIANKKYVDEGLDNKLDKVTTTGNYNILYGVIAHNIQTTYPLTSDNVPNTVVSRDNSGQINVADPTSDENAANKRYVDTSIPDVSNMVTTDTAQTISAHKIFDDGSVDVAASGNTGKALRLYTGGIGLYDAGTNGTRKAYLTLPRTTGTLALTSDIYYQNNDKFVNTGFYNANGYLTGSGKEIGFTIILPKNLKNIKTITVNKLSCVIRGISGYLNGSSNIDYKTQTGITVNAYKSADNAVFIQIKMSNTTWGGTNNTPVSVAFPNGGLDITLNS